MSDERNRYKEESKQREQEMGSRLPDGTYDFFPWPPVEGRKTPTNLIAQDEGGERVVNLFSPMEKPIPTQKMPPGTRWI